MKKAIYIAAIACLMGSTAVYAGNTISKENYASVQQKDKKKKIAEDELPVVIKNMLKSNEYKDWKLDQAYQIEGTSEYYKLELKKDDQTQTLNLDKYGNKVSVLES